MYCPVPSGSPGPPRNGMGGGLPSATAGEAEGANSSRISPLVPTAEPRKVVRVTFQPRDGLGHWRGARGPGTASRAFVSEPPPR